jgi:hypothetical protein
LFTASRLDFRSPCVCPKWREGGKETSGGPAKAGLIDGLWQPSQEPDRQVRFFQADFAVELLILREATMFLVAEAAFRAVEMPIICHC